MIKKMRGRGATVTFIIRSSQANLRGSTRYRRIPREPKQRKCNTHCVGGGWEKRLIAVVSFFLCFLVNKWFFLWIEEVSGSGGSQGFFCVFNDLMIFIPSARKFLIPEEFSWWRWWWKIWHFWQCSHRKLVKIFTNACSSGGREIFHWNLLQFCQFIDNPFRRNGKFRREHVSNRIDAEPQSGPRIIWRARRRVIAPWQLLPKLSWMNARWAWGN